MEQEILHRVRANEKELYSILSKLVRIPSISSKESALMTFINEYCNKLGLESWVDRHGNVVAVLKGTKSGKRLAFNTHADIVAAGNGWTYDPFGGTIVGNKLYGRGSTDAKGAIAAQIIAVKSIIEAEVEFAGEVILCYAVEEEVQNVDRKGTVRMLRDGFTADMCVNGAGVDLRVCLACEGMLEVKITTLGSTAHAVTQHMGRHAIKMMCKIIAELDKIKRGYNKYTGPGAINVGMIRGGERSSVVPDRCEVKVARMTVPGETGAMFLAEVNEIIDRLKTEDPSFDAIAELTYDSNPSIVDENADVVQAIVQAHADLGIACTLTGAGPHFDADFLTNMANIPTVIYGPGTNRMSHAPDEYIILDEVVTAAQVYALTIYHALLK